MSDSSGINVEIKIERGGAVVGMMAGHIDILHVDTRKGKKAWKRPLKREDAYQVTKG